jgi:hypothetical protein
LVRPVTVQLVVEPFGVVQVWPPLEVTVYLVMAEPPFDEDAVHVTTDCVLAFDVPDTLVGADGGPVGVTAFEEADDGPEPAPLVATTLNE